MTPRGSLCLPSRHLQPGGAPKGHCSKHPRHSSLCPLTQASHPDPYETFGDSKLVFTLSSPPPLALSQFFKALFKLFFPP